MFINRIQLLSEDSFFLLNYILLQLLLLLQQLLQVLCLVQCKYLLNELTY